MQTEIDTGPIVPFAAVQHDRILVGLEAQTSIEPVTKTSMSCSESVFAQSSGGTSATPTSLPIKYVYIINSELARKSTHLAGTLAITNVRE